MTYQLVPGTIPYRAVAWLKALPKGAEIPAVVLCEEIGCDTGGFSSTMSTAVKNGLVRRRVNPDNHRQLLWSLGDGTPEPLPDDYEEDKPLRIASDVTKALWSVAAPEKDLTPKRRSHTQVQMPDLDSIQIEDGIPLPSRSGVAKTNWQALLVKLKPGQSAQLPMNTRHTLSNAVTEAKKAGTGIFSIRCFKESDTLRIWRIS